MNFFTNFAACLHHLTVVEMKAYSSLLSEKLSPTGNVEEEEERRADDEGVLEVDVMMERRETGDGGTTDGVVSLDLALL